MKIWVYKSRNGYTNLYPGTHEGFVRARAAQDDDNRCTIEDIIRLGYGEVGGSEEEGRFYADDGGSIELLEVQ